MKPPDEKPKGKIHVIEQGEVPPFGPDQLQVFSRHRRDDSGELQIKFKKAGFKRVGPRSPRDRVRKFAEDDLSRRGNRGMKQLEYAGWLIRQLKMESESPAVVAGYFCDYWQKYVVIPRRRRRRNSAI
jgi:hypothetical protein